MFDEHVVFRRQLRSPGDEFGSRNVCNRIAELPGLLTSEEIPKSPVILRRKYQNLVQRGSVMPLAVRVLVGRGRLGLTLEAGKEGTVNARVCMDV